MHGERNRPEQCQLAGFGELPVAAVENEEGMLPSRAVVSPSVGPSLSLHDAGGLVQNALHCKPQPRYPKTVPVHTAISRLESDRDGLWFPLGEVMMPVFRWVLGFPLRQKCSL